MHSMEGGQFAHLSFGSKKKLSLGIHRTSQLPVTEFNRCIYCGAFINYMGKIFEKKKQENPLTTIIKVRKSKDKTCQYGPIFREWSLFSLFSIKNETEYNQRVTQNILVPIAYNLVFILIALYNAPSTNKRENDKKQVK